MKTSQKVIQTVLKRGHALEEERKELEKSIGLTRFWSEDLDETFQGIELSENHFVLCNQPISFWGCPCVIDLVGVYGIVGDKKVMNHKSSIDLFIKTNRPIPTPEPTPLPEKPNDPDYIIPDTQQEENLEAVKQEAKNPDDMN